MIDQNTTWPEINRLLTAFLSDADPPPEEQESTSNYTQYHRVTSWVQGQRTIVTHTPRQRQAYLTVDQGLRSAILPPDFLKVDRIYDADRQRWMRKRLPQQDGAVRYSDDDLNQWYVWGGHLHFERDLAVGDTDITLYYWAYWSEPQFRVIDDELVFDDERILVPPWAITPLCHYVAALVLQPGAIQAARIRQWNIRVDSGRPTDNSRSLQAREHWWWWHTLLSQVKSPEGWNQ